jgi:hypothetical protein
MRTSAFGFRISFGFRGFGFRISGLRAFAIPQAEFGAALAQP